MKPKIVIAQLKAALLHMCYSTYATAKYEANIVQDALDAADDALDAPEQCNFIEGLHIVNGERWLVQRLMTVDEFNNDKGV